MIFKRKLAYEGTEVFLRSNKYVRSFVKMLILNKWRSEATDRWSYFLFIFFQIKKNITERGLDRFADTVYSMCMWILFCLDFDTIVCLCIDSLNVTSKDTFVFKWVSSQICKLLNTDSHFFSQMLNRPFSHRGFFFFLFKNGMVCIKRIRGNRKWKKIIPCLSRWICVKIHSKFVRSEEMDCLSPQIFPLFSLIFIAVLPHPATR